MTTPLRVLQIEDSAIDIELVHEQLIDEGIQATIHRVETPDEVVAAFGRGDFDIIFCDYNLPKYDGLAALKLASEMCPDIPFIFVSGTIGEARAIEALKLGATDYVLKDDLRRLGTCVERALRESRERIRRQRAEKRISAFSALAHKLSLTSTVEEAGRVIVEVADDLFGWDACTLDLYLADSDSVISIINIDIVNGNRQDVPAMRGNKPPTSRMRSVMEQGAQIILRRPPFEFLDSIPYGDVHRPSASLMFVPIRNGLSMIGTLSIQSYTVNAYTEEDLGTLQSLADHCGGALERIRGELALRESEERYRHFFEEDLAGAYFSTPEGKILACNPEFARILGFDSTAEAMRTNPRDLFANPRNRTAFLDELRKKKRLRHHEEIFQRKDGKEVHVVENVVGIFDEADTLTQLTGYIFDVSEQRTLAEQLRQSQKMEGIGTLAGGIAHDFNNILGIILGHVSLLDAKQVEPENIPQSFQSVIQAVQRGAALVQQLLTFARGTGAAVELTNVNGVIEELVAMLQPTFPKTIEF
ncbi:MAG: response regulator, partial [bacterium]